MKSLLEDISKVNINGSYIYPHILLHHLLFKNYSGAYNEIWTKVGDQGLKVKDASRATDYFRRGVQIHIYLLYI